MRPIPPQHVRENTAYSSTAPRSGCPRTVWWLLLPLALLALGASAPSYENRQASRDGIGKFYLGREIAQVMGHEGAEWLERPERQKEERPDLLLKALDLKPGLMVADIGAGTGYYAWR